MAYNAKNKCNKASKKNFLRNLKKVPRAYEYFYPGVVMARKSSSGAFNFQPKLWPGVLRGQNFENLPWPYFKEKKSERGQNYF